jgi:hypothetical protein
MVQICWPCLKIELRDIKNKTRCARLEGIWEYFCRYYRCVNCRIRCSCIARDRSRHVHRSFINGSSCKSGIRAYSISKVCGTHAFRETSALSQQHELEDEK